MTGRIWTSSSKWRFPLQARLGLADIACLITGCHVTQVDVVSGNRPVLFCSPSHRMPFNFVIDFTW